MTIKARHHKVDNERNYQSISEGQRQVHPSHHAGFCPRLKLL